MASRLFLVLLLAPLLTQCFGRDVGDTQFQFRLANGSSTQTGDIKKVRISVYESEDLHPFHYASDEKIICGPNPVDTVNDNPLYRQDFDFDAHEARILATLPEGEITIILEAFAARVGPDGKEDASDLVLVGRGIKKEVEVKLSGATDVGVLEFRDALENSRPQNVRLVGRSGRIHVEMDSMSGASSYVLCMGTAANSTIIPVVLTGPSGDIDDFDPTSDELGKIVDGTQYFARVFARHEASVSLPAQPTDAASVVGAAETNASTSPGEPSIVFSVTPQAPVPVDKEPIKNDLAAAAATLMWEAAEGATGYCIDSPCFEPTHSTCEVDPAKALALITDQAAKDNCGSTVTESQRCHTIEDPGLVSGRKCAFNIYAVNDDNGFSDAQTHNLVAVAPPRMIDVRARSGEITLNWTPAENADEYVVYMNEKKSGTPYDCAVPVTGGKASARLTESTLAPPSATCTATRTVTPGETYYITVQSKAGGTSSSPLSEEVFVTPLNRVETVRAEGATGKVAMKWSPVPNADGYLIYYTTNPKDESYAGSGMNEGTSPICVEISSDKSCMKRPKGKESKLFAKTLGQTAAAGESQNLLTVDLTGVQDGVTYYFAVSGFSNNPVRNKDTADPELEDESESTLSLQSSGTPLAVPSDFKAAASDGTITLKWSPVTGADGYCIAHSCTAVPDIKSCTVVADSKTVCPPATAGSPSSNSSRCHVITGLTNGVGCGARIQAARGETNKSDPAAQATAMPVGTPSPLAILGATSGATVTWTSLVPGAGSYVLHHDSDKPAPPYAFEEKIDGPTANQAVVGGLKNGITHYFAISATNVSAGTSPISAELSTVPLAKPVISSINSETGTVRLQWTAVPEAREYMIHWDTGSKAASQLLNSFAGKDADFRANCPTNSAAALRCHTLSGLTNGTTYSFALRAYYLKELTQLAAPLTNTDTEIQVGNVIGSLDHTLRIGNEYIGCQSSQVSTSAHRFINCSRGIGLSAVSSAASGTTVYSTNSRSEFSDVKSTSPLAVPTNVRLAQLTDVTTTSITLSWDTVAGASGYNAYYSTTASDPPDKLGTKVSVSGGTTTSTTLTGLTPNTSYYFSVSATNAAGEGGASTPAYEVATLLNTPTNVKLKGGTGRVAVSWKSVAGAAPHMIYRNTVAVQASTGVGITTAGTCSAPFNSLCPDMASNDCCGVITGLTDGTTYYFSVRAEKGACAAAVPVTSANNCGAFTTCTTASKSCAPPEHQAVPLAAPPALAVKTTSGSVTSDRIDLSWTAPAGSFDGYKLYYDTGASGPPYTGVDSTAGFSPILIAATALNFSVTGLKSNVEYYMAITAYIGSSTNPDTESDLPAAGSDLKQTTLLTPPATVAVATGTGKTTVTWTPVLTATQYEIDYGPPAPTTTLQEAVPLPILDTALTATATELTVKVDSVAGFTVPIDLDIDTEIFTQCTPDAAPTPDEFTCTGRGGGTGLAVHAVNAKVTADNTVLKVNSVAGYNGKPNLDIEGEMFISCAPNAIPNPDEFLCAGRGQGTGLAPHANGATVSAATSPPTGGLENPFICEFASPSTYTCYRESVPPPPNQINSSAQIVIGAPLATALTNNTTTYRFQVRAKSGATCPVTPPYNGVTTTSNCSDYVPAPVPTSVPVTPPCGLGGTVTGTTLNLSWVPLTNVACSAAPAPTLAGYYKIYYRLTGQPTWNGTGATISGTAVNSPVTVSGTLSTAALSLETLQSDQSYDFSISTVATAPASGESDKSNVYTVTISIEKPQGFDISSAQGSNPSDNKVVLKTQWDSVPGATSYKLYYSTADCDTIAAWTHAAGLTNGGAPKPSPVTVDPVAENTCNPSPPDNCKYDLADATNDILYFFMVTPLIGGVEGNLPSDCKSIRPLNQPGGLTLTPIRQAGPPIRYDLKIDWLDDGTPAKFRLHYDLQATPLYICAGDNSGPSPTACETAGQCCKATACPVGTTACASPIPDIDGTTTLTMEGLSPKQKYYITMDLKDDGAAVPPNPPPAREVSISDYAPYKQFLAGSVENLTVSGIPGNQAKIEWDKHPYANTATVYYQVHYGPASQSGVLNSTPGFDCSFLTQPKDEPLQDPYKGGSATPGDHASDLSVGGTTVDSCFHVDFTGTIDNSFDDIVAECNDINGDSDGRIACTLSGLNPAISYYFAVRPVSGTGLSPAYGPFSEEKALLPAPTLTTPIDITTNQFSLTWSCVPGAANYKVLWRKTAETYNDTTAACTGYSGATCGTPVDIFLPRTRLVTKLPSTTLQAALTASGTELTVKVDKVADFTGTPDLLIQGELFSTCTPNAVPNPDEFTCVSRGGGTGLAAHPMSATVVTNELTLKVKSVATITTTQDLTIEGEIFSQCAPNAGPDPDEFTCISRGGGTGAAGHIVDTPVTTPGGPVSPLASSCVGTIDIDTTYYFVVQGTGAGGAQGQNSNEGFAKSMDTPRNLKVQAKTGQLLPMWDPVAGANQYNTAWYAFSSTTLAAALNASDLILKVASVGGFPSATNLMIDNELFTNCAPNSVPVPDEFTCASRGGGGAASHLLGTSVRSARSATPPSCATAPTGPPAYTERSDIGVTNETIPGLNNGNWHCVTTRAQDTVNNGKSDYATPVVDQPIGLATGVTATAFTGQVYISWTAPAPGATKQEIKRDAVNCTLLNETAVPVTLPAAASNAIAVPNNATRCFVVVGQNDLTGEGTQSGSVVAQPFDDNIGAPTGMTLQAVSRGIEITDIAKSVGFCPVGGTRAFQLCYSAAPGTCIEGVPFPATGCDCTTCAPLTSCPTILLPYSCTLPPAVPGYFRVRLRDTAPAINGGSSYAAGEVSATPRYGERTTGAWPFVPGVLDRITSSPAVLNFLTGDSPLEIIVGGTNDNVYLLDDDNTAAWTYTTAPAGDVQSCPAVAEIASTPAGKEVAIANDAGILFILKNDGTVADSVALAGPAGLSCPAIADVDGDAPLEVAILAQNGANTDLYAYDVSTTGVLTQLWAPITYGGDLIGGVGDRRGVTPALAEIDSGCLGYEIVFGDATGNIHVICGLTGAEATNCAWPVDANAGAPGGPALNNSPAIARNIDTDLFPEIIVGSEGGSLFKIEADTCATTTLLSGLGAFRSSPALANLDADPELEIIVANDNGNLYAVNGDGSAVAGFPISIGVAARTSPVVADLDNDGENDIFLGDSSGLFHGYRPGLAGEIPGFPVPVSSADAIVSSAAIEDLDPAAPNGLEIVVGSDDGKVHVIWLENVTGFGPLDAWPTFHANNRRTGCIGPAICPP